MINGLRATARHFQLPATALSAWGKLDIEKHRCTNPRARQPGAGRKMTEAMTRVKILVIYRDYYSVAAILSPAIRGDISLELAIAPYPTAIPP